MTTSLEFSIQTGNGLYSCRYEKDVLNVADFRIGMARIKAVEPADADVRRILEHAVSGDEAELISQIERTAMHGEPMG